MSVPTPMGYGYIVKSYLSTKVAGRRAAALLNEGGEVLLLPAIAWSAEIKESFPRT
jgi:hypothetical protein